MHIYHNLWPDVCSFNNIMAAFYKARKTKRTRRCVAQSEFGLEAELLQLQHELKSGKYRPRPYDYFRVLEPKTRDILAPHWRDRIAQHAICNIIGPLFDRTFIDDSYACRPDKGLHYGLRRVRRFVQSACFGVPPERVYYLKLDIRCYFASISWDTLLALLNERLADPPLSATLRTIITTHEYTKQPPLVPVIIDARLRRGIPIGNLTSQLFANLYLNPLDHFIKRELKAQYYGRYMDDMLLIHSSAVWLKQAQQRIGDFLAERLKLKLHPCKVTLATLDRGISFLGYHIFYNHVRIAGKTWRKARRNLFRVHRCVARGECAPNALIAPWQSVRGFLQQANTYHRRERLAGELFDLNCYYLDRI